MAVGSHSGRSTARLSAPEMVFVEQRSGALRVLLVVRKKPNVPFFCCLRGVTSLLNGTRGGA